MNHTNSTAKGNLLILETSTIFQKCFSFFFFLERLKKSMSKEHNHELFLLGDATEGESSLFLSSIQDCLMKMVNQQYVYHFQQK